MSLCCGGGGGAAEELSPEERAAEKELKKEQDKLVADDGKIIKMLLLGAGESGKSTIFKQMKVINKSGYTDKEKKEFVGIVHSNVVQSVNNLLEGFEKVEAEIPAATQASWDKFQELTGDEKLTEESGALVKVLWEDPAVKAVFERRAEFQLNDSAEFYFGEVTRIATADYMPTTDDVLRSRVRTTGIVQSDFEIKNMKFSMFDVGGQRNERRKWIHCFDNVQAVVFVASLSEFDQKLYEDETQNRLDEALDLFQQIVNSKWFGQTAMILFLNKKDLFEQKLLTKTFKDFRTDYDGPNTMKETSEFVKNLFLKKSKNPDKSIYSHVTTAIDTGNVKFVFNAVVGIILEANLKASGLAG